ncbi:MAG: winged helix-turn-helix domain-containing protein [Promethearchaeota archaeon]
MASKKDHPALEPPSTGEKESSAEAALFRNLGHPLRRQIIRFVNDRGQASYTDLRDAFHTEPGTLYFHLEQLMAPDAPLLAQDRDKIYNITPLGQLAATFLHQATDITPSTAPPSATDSHPRLRRLLYYLGLAPLFRYLTRRSDHLILESIITLTALTYLFTIIPLILIGFLPIDFYVPFLFVYPLAFLGSWFFVTIGTEFITRYRYQSPQGSRPLFAASVYAWLPIGLWGIFHLFSYPWLVTYPLVTFLILFLCLTWTLWIYTQMVIHTKRLAMRKAALTTIIITNIALLATLLILLLMIFV